ncbi:Endonuclease/exonuclease/phosphatase [Flammula alnicola]|nr:Endonuclease/exonuclease/phosphatase [Flammula alnicola]
MSLKRKSTASNALDASKKPKVDFFARRTASNVASDSSPSASFSFKPKVDACTRLITWNVNGIMSVNEKILKKYLEAEDPTILILTETKYSKGKADLMCLKTRFKYQYWGVDLHPGHAGTAVLSKFKPLRTAIGLPEWEESSGRYVELEFEDVFVIGTYVPNSGENFKTMDLKRKYNDALRVHLRELEAKKPPADLDGTARALWGEMSGLSEEERNGLATILHPEGSEEPVLVDVWRHLHPADEEYTHSSTKYGSWRLDSFIVSRTVLEKADSCVIRYELKDFNLSDHWPVTLDIAVNLSSKGFMEWKAKFVAILLRSWSS